MKRLIVGLIALFGYYSAPAAPQELPVGESLSEFQWSRWDDWSFETKPQETTFFGELIDHGSGGQTNIYGLTHSVTTPLQLTLRTLGPAITSQITSPRFAIKGKLKYEGIPTGSFLEMASFFAPSEPGGQETVHYTRTTGFSGPEAQMEGTDDGRDFLLAYDASGEKTKLVRLAFNLHLAGKGTVGFWDVKLVQYGEAASSPTAASGSLTIKIHPGRDSGVLLSVDDVDYSMASIKKLLKERHQADSNRAVIIKADKTVSYTDIVQLLNVCAATGIANISFATDSQAEAAAPPPSKAPTTTPSPFRAFPSQTVEPLPWNFSPQEADAVIYSLEGPATPNNIYTTLKITYSGKGPRQLKLRTVPSTPGGNPPAITTHHYAIMGDLKTEGVAAGSYLEMWSHFVSPEPGEPDQQFFSRTLAEAGPMGKLDGSQGLREFLLPFDSTGATGNLTQLDFNLHFSGPGVVWLRNMRLVQYPDPAVDKGLATKVPSAPAEEGIHWRSFSLGVVTSAVGAAVCAACVSLFRHLSRRRHEQELRRIASLDG